MSNRLLPILTVAAALGVGSWARAETPSSAFVPPAQLQGTWWVSLCVKGNHAWIRFQNADTGKVHTLCRAMKGWGQEKDPATGQIIKPGCPFDGVMWDADLDFDQPGKPAYLHITTIVKDPMIFKGANNGQGYGKFKLNCAVFARDAWHDYSGDSLTILVPSPEALEGAIWRRYPQARQMQRPF